MSRKNFVACNLHGRGMYSLGVRASVLRLELFQSDTVKAQGHIVAPSIMPAEAFSHGLRTARARLLLYRRVLGQVLSIIYFPYWVVEVNRAGENFLTILDAVSASVNQLEASMDLYPILNHKPKSEPQIIGFRPLCCPNCGWDLPIRKDDVVFSCSSCRKAWQIFGNDLYEVKYEVARAPEGMAKAAVRHLPFWVLRAKIREDPPVRFFLPAFRFSRLKALKDLAQALTQKQPEYSPITGPTPDLHGCFYDQEDAVKLAQMTYVGMSSRKQEAIEAMEENPLKITGLSLTWLPFRERGLSLIEPSTGFAIPRNLLR